MRHLEYSDGGIEKSVERLRLWLGECSGVVCSFMSANVVLRLKFCISTYMLGSASDIIERVYCIANIICLTMQSWGRLRTGIEGTYGCTCNVYHAYKYYFSCSLLILVGYILLDSLAALFLVTKPINVQGSACITIVSSLCQG